MKIDALILCISEWLNLASSSNLQKAAQEMGMSLSSL
jgi:hypothetical protein